MSEMQLIEEQHIYEIVRSGITEGSTTFEQTRWVLDNLEENDYVIVKRTALLEHEKMREACNGAREALENCTPPRSGLSGILYSYGHYSHKKINRKEMEMAEKALASLDAALKEGE